MALYQKIYVTRSTIYMESFLIVSQNAQPSHYAALLYSLCFIVGQQNNNY